MTTTIPTVRAWIEQTIPDVIPIFDEIQTSYPWHDPQAPLIENVHNVLNMVSSEMNTEQSAYGNTERYKHLSNAYFEITTAAINDLIGNEG